MLFFNLGYLLNKEAIKPVFNTKSLEIVCIMVILASKNVYSNCSCIEHKTVIELFAFIDNFIGDFVTVANTIFLRIV